MSTDQIEVISRLIQDVFTSAPSSPDAQLCATLEVVGQPDAWLQLLPGTLNFAYPLATDPAQAISPLFEYLPESSVLSWEQGTFATIEFGEASPHVVATAIDILLTTLFSLGEYSVNGTIEEMPA